MQLSALPPRTRHLSAVELYVMERQASSQRDAEYAEVAQRVEAGFSFGFEI
jgi:hypothetical protein